MKTIEANRTFAAMTLFASAAIAGLALATPVSSPSPNQANTAGIVLSDLSSESYAGAVQVNANGAVLTVDGSADSSVDTRDSAGITAYPGRVDPDFRGRNAAGIIWMTEPGLAK